MTAASSATEGSEPSSSLSSAAVSESPSGASAIVWAPCTRVNAPSYSGRDVINTIDGVRAVTVKKSASIDSLTASIQCASSMMNSAGSVRAIEMVLTSAVNRRRRASRSIWGGAHVGDPEQVVEQKHVLRVGVGGDIGSQSSASGVTVEVSRSAARTQQTRHGVERDVTCMGLAEDPKHLRPHGAPPPPLLHGPPSTCRFRVVPPR